MQDGQCPPQALCTFDDPSMCGWRNIHGDNFDWTRSNGGTVSAGTGPRNDHTYGTTQGIGFSYKLMLIMIYSCSKVGRVSNRPTTLEAYLQKSGLHQCLFCSFNKQEQMDNLKRLVLVQW